MLFNSFEVVGNWWKFKEVISPFTRLYLITEGEGWVYHLCRSIVGCRVVACAPPIAGAYRSPLSRGS